MDPFATPEELANFLQNPAVETSTAAPLVLRIATARIVRTTGQQFTFMQDDVVTLSGGSERLRLPQHPVQAVTAVETTGRGEPTAMAQVAGIGYELDAGELVWMGGDLPRLNGSPRLPYLGYAWPARVKVTYDHGYQIALPDDVVGCCLLIAAELLSGPDGITFERVDDYAWRKPNAAETAGAIALKELKAAYGCGAYSVRAR